MPLRSPMLLLVLQFSLFLTSPAVADEGNVTDGAEATDDDRPNIIFILADDYGYYDIGYHGNQIKTPNLDAHAESGVRLENYYVQHICVPTRSQLLSGRYQIHTGLQHGNTPRLPLDSLTIADQMKRSGYSTHMAGKWHLGFRTKEEMPMYRGFDTYLGFLKGHGTYYSHKVKYNGTEYLDWRDETGPRFNESGLYSTHLLTGRAVEKIREHDPSNGPIFIFLSYQAVHNPLSVPKRYKEPYKHIKDSRRRRYAAMASCMDEGVGNVTQALKDKGIWDNTILIFSSDNGANPDYAGSNFPLRGRKFTLWEGGVHAIGFVAGGRVGPKGVINRDLMHVTDWFPTLVNLAKGDFNGTQPLDGYDQWETINGTATSPRTVILHNIDIAYTRHGLPDKRYEHVWDTTVRAAIRVGDLKLLTGNVGDSRWFPKPVNKSKSDMNGIKADKIEMAIEPELKNLWMFNITADPQERYDLSEERPDDVLRLMHELVKFNQSAVAPKRNIKPHDPSTTGGVWGPWVE